MHSCNFDGNILIQVNMLIVKHITLLSDPLFCSNTMASRSWCMVMVVLACLQYRVAAGCKIEGSEGESCHQCYQTLESYLLNTSDNKHQLRRVFYPLEVADPVFVTVTYQYIDTNTTKLWFWSMGIFYFLQPIEVFQFTSLFFGNPSWRSSQLNITLPSECENASNDFMTELTQMVRNVNDYTVWDSLES